MTRVATGSSFELDVSRFPVVVLSLRGPLGPVDATAMTKALDEQVFQRRSRYRLLIDATHAEVPSADVRKHFVEFSSKNSDFTKRYCEGEAYVMPSALVRGALTAVMWFAPFQYPHKVFATVEEARRWLDALTP